MLIPAAYRSLSRPSSPLRAKASPVYPFLLSSTHTPFARMVCFLILAASLESGAKSQESRPKSLSFSFFLSSSESQQSSILLSSLSIYFFQYVKELIRMCRFQMCGCADDFSFAHLHIFSFAHSQVENNGFEPLTLCVQGRCSSQLS